MSESSPDIFSGMPQTTIVIMLKLTVPSMLDVLGAVGMRIDCVYRHDG
jgi:hypothetical protein